ncbi:MULTISPECIES: penicillin-binding protein 2 [Chromohalobacter]|uniref:Peptidoglycan D,D-transpeptidase MrdA n=1 Tax=Chromohalobacter israelensis (strain ATCC BAA-138 / DSM 3043 / CIP 106854 / NCIMB 13768 / 1H11) TaxID=290398 RepID=Q1QXB0_CHRI1|nr:penicillin-binding protein 2 [Chromohalobacter salexigens]ABE58898.1 cell elongation-specific peptidoglycan D,D-transpeptidase [Chromohalobacter salexigens DSM 3043]MDO0944980.1 penicillin-binding protein 2 [Chromohalobacter salexigens]NWO54676.1 penicillin-binding protein 2 [Chromohalobacter salexigens]RXE48012.1 penicillin-binding protein 2 [Chromohalobacter salexigens]
MRKRRDAIKDTEREVRVFRGRSFLAAVLVLLMAGGLGARLFYLQVVEHEVFTTRSENNRVRVEPLPPTRGLIYDRQGKLVAENRPTYNLTIVRERVDDLDATLERLVDVLGLDEDQVAAFRKRSRQRQRPYQPALLMSDLSERQIAHLAVNRYRLPGVEVEAQWLRYYPDPKIMSHVLGYVGRINEQELASLDGGNYAGTHYIGKTGIEKQYEAALHGQAGLRKVETNARGRVLRELERTPPQPGKDLTLTIDTRLQQLAYDLLDGRRGSIVAIQPQTGDILAMVSAPGFDSNKFVTGISYKDYQALQQDLDLPLFNRAVRGHYPPGSTIKPFEALAALQHGVVTPDEVIYDPGYYKLPNDSRHYRNWLRWGHGRVDLERALAVSNNTYFYTMAHRLGIDALSSFMHKFGFGEVNSLDVQGASAGTVPSREWKRAKYDQPWYPGETLSAGIGQGYWMVTPLQLATAEATLANRGHWVRPHLAKRVGETTVEPPFENTRQDVELDKDAWWDDVFSGMQKVVSGREGTARHIGKGLKYEMAGKSGTAQVFSLGQNQKYDADELRERLRDHALFTAFAPVDDPQIAIAVIVENAGGGSSHAAGLARALADEWLLPDDENTHQAEKLIEEDVEVEGT